MTGKQAIKAFGCGFLFFLLHFAAQAQFAQPVFPVNKTSDFVNHEFDGSYSPAPIPKLYQRNYGMTVGLQRGRYTFIELGGEAHWRKISLKKPTIIGANANMQYNFGHHVLGYNAGMWMKRGRVNFTYGGNVGYYTDFKDHSKFAIGPAIGFRLLGFHLINGYNILIGDKDFDKVNTLYMTLRYYFPIDNKFIWDKPNKNRKDKERERRKREKRKRDNNKDKKKILGIFSI